MRGVLARLLVTGLLPMSMSAQQRGASPRAEIEAFNHALENATRHMDNAATLALWDDDGVSLLPSTKPVVGKKAIADFLTSVTSTLGGAHMESFAMACRDIETSGDWASEWCTEHQVVRLPGNKTFDGRGTMLFVLHRGTDAKWRIKREMWNQGASTDSAGKR